MAKKGIHPEYYQAKITNSTTGKSFVVGSTKKDIKVDIFIENHPFTTDGATLAKQDGQVQKFNRRFSKYNNEK